MEKADAIRYLRSLVYQNRIERDGVLYRAWYCKSIKTAQRIEDVLNALGGWVCEYIEYKARASLYDNWRSQCEVVFALPVKEDPLDALWHRMPEYRG